MSGTLEFIFTRLNNLLTETINTYSTLAGHDDQVEGAVQVRRGIEYAQTCYEAHLNQTIDEMDDPVYDVFQRLYPLAEGVINNQANVITTVRRETQQIVNSIFQESVMGRSVPQLTTARPHFVLSNVKTIHFVFEGNFSQGQNPSLVFGSTSFQPTSIHAQRLEFNVPKDTVFPTPEIPHRVNVSNHGLLTIPFTYAQGQVPINRSSVTYKIFMRSVPTSTGPIVWSWNTTHDRYQSRTREKGRFAVHVTGHPSGPHPDSALYQQLYDQAWHVCSCSNGDCANTVGHQPTNPVHRGTNDNVNNRSFTAYPSPGWTIQPNTPFIRLEVLQGSSYSHTPNPGLGNQNQVTYHVSTQHHGGFKPWGGNTTSDSVNVNIGFVEQRRWTENTTSSETITMLWGQSHSFTIPNSCNQSCLPKGCTSSWVITHETIRGESNQYWYSIYNTNPQDSYMTAQSQQYSVTLTTPQVNQLPEFV